MLSDKTIGVLGAGNMGEALIAGLVKACVVEPGQVIASRRSDVPVDSGPPIPRCDVNCAKRGALHRTNSATTTVASLGKDISRLSCYSRGAIQEAQETGDPSPGVHARRDLPR